MMKRVLLLTTLTTVLTIPFVLQAADFSCIFNGGANALILSTEDYPTGEKQQEKCLEEVDVTIKWTVHEMIREVDGPADMEHRETGTQPYRIPWVLMEATCLKKDEESRETRLAGTVFWLGAESHYDELLGKCMDRADVTWVSEKDVAKSTK